MSKPVLDYSPDRRATNTITAWEFAAIGTLLCDHSMRELALMVVRLQGQLEAERMLRGSTRQPADPAATGRGFGP